MAIWPVTKKIISEKFNDFFVNIGPTLAKRIPIIDKSPLSYMQSLDNGETALGIYLDFAKAFDTVNHEILLKKLYHYGIRGNAYAWFQSYLSGRVQYVTYNNVQ